MVDERVVPLAGVCLGRTVPIEHVRALFLAGLLEQPIGDQELVPHDLLATIDSDPVPTVPAGEWRDHLAREVRRFRAGRVRLLGATGPEHARRREQQLMRIGSAAWGAALALLMERQADAARVWFDRAATFYRRSLADAEPGSWGRSIGPLKARVLADDAAGAAREARWTLELGAAASLSPTARYAACLSFLVIWSDAEAEPLAHELAAEPTFPPATASALLALSVRDRLSYADSIRAILETFETRARFLEDVPVADTVLTLQALAQARGLDTPLQSPRLPPDA